MCFFPSWGKFGTRLTWKFIYFKRETFKLVGWCWSSQESEAIDFVGIYCLLFFLKVKFSCCIPDRGQSGRVERPCDTAQDCQVIFSRLLIFWSSACIPQIGQLNRQRLNVSMHESLLLAQEGEVSVNAVLCRRIIFALLPTLNVTTDAHPISHQQCSSLR